MMREEERNELTRFRELALEGLSSGGDECYKKILALTEEMLDNTEPLIVSHDSIYQSIIHKLAQEYFRIFYVDIRTDDYLAYDPFDPHAEFDVDHIEDDFFLQSSRAMFDTLYEEDVDSFFSGFKKEKVLQSIDEHGEFSLNISCETSGWLLLRQYESKPSSPEDSERTVYQKTRPNFSIIVND